MAILPITISACNFICYCKRIAIKIKPTVCGSYISLPRRLCGQLYRVKPYDSHYARQEQKITVVIIKVYKFLKNRLATLQIHTAKKQNKLNHHIKLCHILIESATYIEHTMSYLRKKVN